MNMIEKLRQMGISADDLDDLVHKVASKMASEANQSGLKGQCEFLLQAGLNEENILEEVSQNNTP
jgi:hypothetical protein